MRVSNTLQRRQSGKENVTRYGGGLEDFSKTTQKVSKA